MPGDSGNQKPIDLPCCISHEFFRSASRDPDRVAVVHATGGIRVCRELRAALSSSAEIDVGGLLGRHRESSSPAVYRGDVCYTYGDVLLAVETLSVRIRRILDGGDDPDVVRPKCLTTAKQSHIIQKSGCRLPKIVGICIAPSIEYIVSVLAVLRCGEAFLPLDPLWPKDRIESLTASSNAALIVICAPASSSIGKVESSKFDWVSDENGYSLVHLTVDKCLQDKQLCNTLVWPCKDKNPRLFCYLMYTSGSTGKPKGVCGTERGLVNRHVWMQGFSPLCNSDILLFKTSIIFIDHIQEFLAPMLTCSALVIPPFYELKANPSYLVHVLKVYSISRLTAVPSLMRAIIPFFQSLSLMVMQISSLKLLILSGEALSISLWQLLCHLLPDTTILNLYGSTEVSGDCLYFDCNNLSEILKVEALTTVPIGVPISNCDVMLCSEQRRPEEGELCVGGSCLFVGYLDNLDLQHAEERSSCQLHFRTGDFARRLPTGQYVFTGRKDRTLKINGQRVALEEIETIINEHPVVSDAAVVPHRTVHDTSYLAAFIVPKTDANLYKDVSFSVDTKSANEEFVLGLRKWLLRKVPLAMIPSKYIFINILPVTSTGKVDHPILESSLLTDCSSRQFDTSSYCHDHLEIIKEAFCDALLVEEITELDDFFVLGGNSMSAAQVAHTLGIDMRLLYLFPTPVNLLNALYSKASNGILFIHNVNDRKRQKIQDASLRDSEDQKRTIVPDDRFHRYGFRASEIDSHMSPDPKQSANNAGLWSCHLPSDLIISFNRCNYMRHGMVPDAANKLQACMAKICTGRNGSLQELWKVPLFSCVDASPLLLLKDGEFYLFIGSHSLIFLCIDAMSGAVRWEVKLDGRIECSAAMTDDFSQVVVGCHMGRVYFIDFRSGIVSWVFQTDGEVKMQPVSCNSLIWCGSHDHYLYALDYHEKSCVFKISCGGSAFGSPSIDRVKRKLYVASTTGRVTALCIEAPSFCMVWLQEMGVPIFGTPCLDPLTGNVICCLVDGSVLALDAKGSIIWKATTGGPIFAGACISALLPSQVLICSRNGTVYSFERGNGQLLWEYDTGDPITAAAYVDEQIELKSDPSLPSERLVCICSSSGGIHVLRVSSAPRKQSTQEDGSSKTSPVELFAKRDLPGDIFSSPVMIRGRIFVGCRDDYVHCLDVIT